MHGQALKCPSRCFGRCLDFEGGLQPMKITIALDSGPFSVDANKFAQGKLPSAENWMTDEWQAPLPHIFTFNEETP